MGERARWEDIKYELLTVNADPIGPKTSAMVRIELASRRIALLEQDLAVFRDLASDMSDGADCRYDHHGYCQTHCWFETDPACPHKRYRAATGGGTPTPTAKGGE